MLNELDEAGVIDHEGEAVKWNRKGKKRKKEKDGLLCAVSAFFILCVRTAFASKCSTLILNAIA